jgi:spore photoproduct lyase
MIETIYYEEELKKEELAPFKEKYPEARTISIKTYGEVFNRKGQNFRLQKRKPSLILARKYGRCVIPSPQGFGIGGEYNYYFSHILNCLYDCRYCFLQGMFRSAHYVHFVNHMDYKKQIDETLLKHPSNDVYFFSGYDGDSLALESLTNFTDKYLPFFRNRPRAILELRTKSNRIGPVLKQVPFNNCVIAFTFTPKEISEQIEHNTPSVPLRIKALKKLALAGWNVGIRLDPLIDHENFKECYYQLFVELFESLPINKVHSISLGPLRMPKKIFKKMRQLYPKEKLFNTTLEETNGIISYSLEREEMLQEWCSKELLKWVSEDKLFCYFANKGPF